MKLDKTQFYQSLEALGPARKEGEAWVKDMILVKHYWAPELKKYVKEDVSKLKKQYGVSPSPEDDS